MDAAGVPTAMSQVFMTMRDAFIFKPFSSNNTARSSFFDLHKNSGPPAFMEIQGVSWRKGLLDSGAAFQMVRREILVAYCS